MPKVLIFLHYYLPGYRAGGPLQSISNLVTRLGGIVDFSIVASDRDFLSMTPYDAIEPDRWTPLGHAVVCYLSPSSRIGKIRRILREQEHDILYLQSFFDPWFSIVPMLLSRFRKPILIAPRGEFGSGALAQKPWKKKCFLFLFRLFGMHRRVVFHCSTPLEAGEVRKVMGSRSRVRIALNIADAGMRASLGQPAFDGPLKLVFLSRINNKKNLFFALNVLRECCLPVEFRIYGPREDAAYWEQCEAAMAELPENVWACYCGEVVHQKVLETLAENHVMFFPTRNENFGHAICEALKAGVPVLCSDQTPWTELEARGAGWGIPLSRPQEYLEKLETYYRMSREKKDVMRHAAQDYAAEMVENPAAEKEYLEIFNNLIGES